MNYYKLLLALLVFGACSENKSEQQAETVTETSEEASATEEKKEPTLISTLEIIDVETKERRVVYSSDEHFEAPNWTGDGSTLVFNSKGKLYKIPVTGGEPEEIYTDFAIDCNNDHLLSPDGTEIAISHHIEENHTSKIYILPFEGGTPRLITPRGPSYLHGWSPDGTELAYCAERNGDYNIFVIDTTGEGIERQLTEAEGLDDGPEYGPEGKYIYFNSVRSGTMQIWRMKTDGSEQTQITKDKYNDWFAHISPNNEKMVFISYDTTVAAGNHPPNENVRLRTMELGGTEPETLLELFGGQGTINVPSWSLDSKEIAFVSYKLKK